MTDFPTVSIVVPYYNQEHIVKQSVTSLLAQDYPRDKLTFVFVNDGSSDRTGKILAGFVSDPRITVLDFRENQGRSEARNAGIRAGTSEMVGFLDGDMTVAGNWLRQLVGIFKDDITGVMGDSRLPAGKVPNRLDRYFYSYYRGARQVGENRPLHFRWFLFNNAVVRRDVLERIGLFNETFRTYGGEDTDLAIRLWEENPQGLRFSTRAVSYHHHKRTVAGFCAVMEKFGYDNLPKLVRLYPQHHRELAADWVGTIKGKVLFNPAFRLFAKLALEIMPVPALVRYLVVDAVMRGARRSELI